ncbi:hypothetical protein KIN20_031227 [Parelaphostrongylus tenuis]|uniref:Nuclear pore complex protein n=1 Tax=Parelaphostrongylus tenuis TaxID=148309 RepID=A0AAD5WHG4_PARTN|nr:hypothetical protein KIN20_031227 [Parelaphostrongylus tenuis]
MCHLKQERRNRGSVPECFKTNKKISACAACDYKNEGRVASESPVSNVTSSVKPAASHDKCACCGHVMYKSGETQATSNAFGERAFKAGTTPSTISFGFGGSNTSSSGKTFKFGFGASDVTESAATNTDSSAIKTTTIAPVIPKSVLSSEPGKDTLANTPPLCKSTTESTNPHASTFTIGSGTGLFGSQPKPPLFDSVSSTAFKPSSFTGSFMPTLSTSAPTNTSTTLAAGKSSQGVSISAPAPLVFGSGSTSLLGQAGLPNAKDAENNPNRATPFGSTLSFGALPSSSAEVLPSTTTTSGSNAEPTGIVPSATSNIFGTAGAAKPVFSPFGITPESSKPFMNTVTSTGNQEVSTSSQVQAPLFGISSTTFANKPLFGASTSSASSNSNGGPGFIFGSTNTFGGFGNATSSTTVSSSLPTISSNAPIFGSATSVPEAQKPFQFNTTLPESIFQFGKEPLSGSTPFQFGSMATSSVPSFQTSGIAAPAAPSSNFTFTSTNNRRIASARRRLPPRK